MSALGAPEILGPLGIRQVVTSIRLSEHLAGPVVHRLHGDMIEHDSDEEIEIRAQTLYATALLTDAINEIRPADKQVVVPQIDFRLWNAYHATSWPHHLTRTVMY